ncbi:MAG: LamG domain-containing protein [Candidatus Poribacteria bacterium]|nr:LamG domain-containing protein [Candidatus Poribacteria bacterium]
MRWITLLFVAVLLFTTSQAIARLDRDLVVYFTFDKVKGEKILDASGNNLNAHIVANVDFAEGKYRDGMDIAAEPEGDDCVHIPADDLLKIAGEITMMAWVYHEDWDTALGSWLDRGSRILAQERNRSYGMGFFDGGLFAFKGADIGMVLGAGQITRSFTTNGPIVNKSWHHIAGTYDGRIWRIYMNGIIHSEGEENFEFSGTNDFDLRIGCAAGSPRYTFRNGSIDEVGVWRRALTQAEIQEAMKDFLSVSPKNKVAATWGDIKRGTIVYK